MLILTYHGSTAIPLEAEAITPDNFAQRSLAEIAALPVQHGNRPAKLGDYFDLQGDAADRHLLIHGDCSRVKLLGSKMHSGKITIQGDAGMHLGAEMTGGEIEVHGNVGDWAGAEMRGGRMHIHGNASDLVGAGYRGSRLGMRGGAILVDGRAGNEIGATMRRGLIAVGGDVGEFAGVGMIAGSLLLFGKPGPRVGAGMKRGTIVLFAGPVPLLPSFRFGCVVKPVFINLYMKQLAQWNFSPAASCPRSGFRRYTGDMVGLGKGEILVAIK